MPTLTVDEKVVFDWLDSWWPVVSSWLPDPEPLIGPKWDTLVHKAAAVIPEELHGVDLQPLKELLYAMVAFGEPSDINGLKPTADEIRDRSSKAWRTYQRLTALVQNRITQEKSDASGRFPRDEFTDEDRPTGEGAVSEQSIRDVQKVTPRQVAKFLGIELKSLVKTSWPAPVFKQRGSRPAEYLREDLLPVLKRQYPQEDWDTF